MRLLFEKIKLAIQKRTKIATPQKSYAAWAAKGYQDQPLVSIVIQSHNKSLEVCHLLPKLRQFKDIEIIVIDDGSSEEHTRRLARALTGANEFLVRANDLYENRTYDKAIRFSNGQFIALLQDDDDFDERLSWYARRHAEGRFPLRALREQGADVDPSQSVYGTPAPYRCQLRPVPV